ncbi:DUF4245 domain-containing protein [Actinokineospora spheciospongiae]|nr:DUF4245 domain-containing protein [Actinokineospora spheciospongiae]
MGGVATPGEPAGPPPKNRLNQGLRDMVLSLIALLVIIAALLLFNKSCSFNPGGPAADTSSLPTVDVEKQFEQVAGTLDFPLRLPSVPGEWRANSSSTGPAAPASVVVRVGWLTPERYVQLSQSGADPADLVRAETENESPPTGSVEVDGTQWTVHPGRRAERAWTVDLGDTSALITGTGTEEEFRTLARAVQTGRPVEED